MDALPITMREYISANTTTRETWECLIPGKPRSMSSSTLVPAAVCPQVLKFICKDSKVSVGVCMPVLGLQMLLVVKQSHHP